MAGGVPRILHVPADVGGNAYGLSRAERQLGFDSDVAVFSKGPFQCGADIDIGAGADQPLVRRFARRIAFLRRALKEYDAFHFNFGQTILSVRQLGCVADELALVKRSGKTIFATFQGCDVRPFSECACQNPACAVSTAYRAPAAARFLRYADRVCYVNPDLRKWLPGATFTPYASVDARSINAPAFAAREELLIVHAPSDRRVKGTRHAVEAIERLQVEGLRVRLDLVEGVPNEEAMRRAAQADIVVDQLLIGWYGAFAVEAMALAKPVLCFIREDEPEDNPFGAELPIVRTTAGTLAEDLRILAAEPERRRELGRAGRRFAEEHHDPRKIARTVLDGIVPIPGRQEAVVAPPAG